MLKVRRVVQWSLVLAIAAWIGLPARGDAGGSKAPRDQRLCDQMQAALLPEFNKVVSEHNVCKTSSDCAVATPGCPFDCYVGVRTSDVAVVEARAWDLTKPLQPDCLCKYMCRAKPPVSCVRERCVIGPNP
jgi:hypothetical protein